MVRTAINTIEAHLIARLGSRPVADIDTLELQRFLNEYISSGASRSLLQKILRHMPCIFDHAVSRRIISFNPARDPGAKLRAKARTRESNEVPDDQRVRAVDSSLHEGARSTQPTDADPARPET